MSAALEPGLRVRCIKREQWRRADTLAPSAGPAYGTFWTIAQIVDTAHGDALRFVEWPTKEQFLAVYFEPEGERGLEQLRAVLRKLPAQAPQKEGLDA